MRKVILKKMKISLTIIIGVLCSISISYAQVLKPNSEVTASHTTYKTQATSNTMSVRNKGNKLNQKMAGLEGENFDYNLTDKSSLIKCFRSVFSPQRLKQLLPEHRISISFYINASGKVLETSFILNQNTLVTVNEIEELENQIKNNVTFKVRPGALKESKFYIVIINVKFDKILTGIQ